MRNSKKKGFTIVELVIVIAVISILSAVLIPTFAGLVNKANETALQENLTNAYTTYAASFEASDNELYSKEEVVFVDFNGTLTVETNGTVSGLDAEGVKIYKLNATTLVYEEMTYDANESWKFAKSSEKIGNYYAIVEVQ